MSHHRRTRVWLSLTLGALLAICTPLVAYAGINDLPDEGLGTSTTNPWDREDPTVWWREGWGNSVFPQFELYLPSGTAVDSYPQVLGTYYVVDRTQTTEIDESRPQDYDSSPQPLGTTLDQTLDLPGILAANPLGLASTDSGARLPIEGRWWFHWSFYDVNDVASRTISGPFGIDVTPPLPISKLAVKPYVGYTGPAGVWMPNERAVISWEDKEYDALSGTAAYEVWLNDEQLLAPSGGPLYVFHLGHTYTSLTLEHLAQGKNTITIKSVDRATNVGPGVSAYYYVDSDTPKLEITAPKAGAMVGKSALFSVNATDGAGISRVQFFLDGAPVYTDTTAPYALAKDMGAYANGTHQLMVKAWDMYGREVVATRDFVLDKTPPVLSSVSDSPDPFYPVLVDGYHDYSTVRFYSSEKVYAYLYYYKANGTLFTGRSAPRGPGWGTISWNGRDLQGNVGIGTFGYRVMIEDAAGNQAWSGMRSSTIRDYEIIRIAPNAVRVIPR